MNQFNIAGRLGSDAKTSNGRTELRVAVNKGPVTDWYWIYCFKSFGQACSTLKKGDGVSLQGQLSINSFNGREKVELVGTVGTFFRKNRPQETEQPDAPVPA